MTSAPSQFIPLDAVRVAAPCHADWDRMTGDDRARFCGSCEKHVYNLSGMTRAEAEELIRSHEGKLCVRFSRRADGTIISDNCPVGLQALRESSSRPVRWTASVIVMLLMPLATVVGTVWLGMTARHSAAQSYAPRFHLRQVQPFRAMQDVQPVKALLDKVDPEPMIMGEMMAAPPPPGATTPGATTSGTN